MKFTTPCFVRVEDTEKREQLCKWCKSLGYCCPDIPKEERLGELVICDEECVGIVHNHAIFSIETAYIDCGDNIELFKALAAMNDAPSQFKHQWVINEEGDMCLCEYNNPAQLVIRGMLPHNIGLRKATAEEIIEHFKNRKG